ncbi:uncharacterized protein LOC131399768 [Diceros bicornis minor]|uniref:uncharacterized protein LOC131399768 n=1 Tax=Diceros bicornis minor TaxID=77932 RepID=UPI0026EB65B1|nr:uncharacterized protein LOC131399768 [Diceros bicornis minor]
MPGAPSPRPFGSPSRPSSASGIPLQATPRRLDLAVVCLAGSHQPPAPSGPLAPTADPPIPVVTAPLPSSAHLTLIGFLPLQGAGPAGSAAGLVSRAERAGSRHTQRCGLVVRRCDRFIRLSQLLPSRQIPSPAAPLLPRSPRTLPPPTASSQPRSGLPQARRGHAVCRGTAESPSPLQVATAPTAGPEFSLRLLLVLLLLRRDCHWAARGDARSLCYDFTIIPKLRPGQSWCEVQGQVDEKTFLSYDVGRDEVKSLSLLGEEVNGTRAWQEQMETLRDVGGLLRQQLPDIKPEKYTDGITNHGSSFNPIRGHDHHSHRLDPLGDFRLLSSPRHPRLSPSQPASCRAQILSDCAAPAWSREAHSLCYEFTISPKPKPGQPWCEVQGKVNRDMFLHYHCGGEKFEPEGRLGMKVNTTEAWGRQSEALKELVEELRKKLLEVEREISTTSDPLTLQGRMMCLCKANGRTSGSWQFGLDGQIFLLFDSENRNWTVLQPGGRLLKWTLANDRDATTFLMKILNGDCRNWLEQFLLHWEKMLETTASPTTAPATAQSRATAITPITWILLVTLLCSLLLGILG